MAIATRFNDIAPFLRAWRDDMTFRHDMTDRFVTNKPQIPPLCVFIPTKKGVFFRSGSGFMERLYFDGQWKHDRLDSGSNRSSSNYQVNTEGGIGVTPGGTVVYRGNNGRIQHFYLKNGTTWVRDDTDRWVNPKPKALSRYLAATSRGVFFRGEGRTGGGGLSLERLYWNQADNRWAYDPMDDFNNRGAGSALGHTSEIHANATPTVFFVGQNYRLQHYYRRSDGRWVRDETDRFFGPLVGTHPRICVTEHGVFAHNQAGYLERYYWNGSQWAHDPMDSGSNRASTSYKVSQAMNSSGEYCAAPFSRPGSNHVFFVGRNQRVQHFYLSGSTWIRDNTDGPVNPKPKVHPKVQHLAVTQRGVFFCGDDGFMERLFWNGSQWAHDPLDQFGSRSDPGFRVNEHSKILANDNGTVFYVGASGRMQHFYYS